MKICIPIKENKGMGSLVYSHFGSAPRFLLHDTETGETKTIQNKDLHHAHGTCQPMKALGYKAVDVVIVGAIGRGAIAGLNGRDIKVYQSSRPTVQENIDRYMLNLLRELTPAEACVHHGGCEA